MKVTRPIFARRGCVLTALAVAVLLAGFSGTVWAQTTVPLRVGLAMRASSSTLEEGASMAASTPDRVTLTITRSGADTYDDDGDSMTPAVPIFTSGGNHLTLRATCNGEGFTGEPTASDCSFSVAVKDAASNATLGATSTLGVAGSTLSFGDGPDTDSLIDKTIELVISDDSDNGDWNSETIVLILDLQQASVGSGQNARNLTAPTPRVTLTISDDEQLPKLKFTPPRIQLAKGNTQPMTVGVGVGAGGQASLPTAASGTESMRATLNGLTGDREDVLLSVSPPDAVGMIIEIKGTDATGAEMTLEPDGQGRYNIGKIGHDSNAAAGDPNGAVGAVDATTNDGIALSITAKNVSGFRDEQITLTLMDGRTEAQKMVRGGIEDSNPATITILSGEETPTVTFSKSSVSIDEGGMETVHLLADTDQGSQVGSASVSVSGDARISLEQNGSPISGGSVDFGGSANAELTIRALGDESLEDGEEKTATVTITDASSANIGDPRAITVTVVGSTAVPVLPLVGQLLLALLLTAGGARLYRRRQQ